MMQSCSKFLTRLNNSYALNRSLLLQVKYQELSKASNATTSASKRLMAGKALLSSSQIEERRGEISPEWQIGQVPGGGDKGAMPCLKRSWKMKSFMAGITFFNDVAKVAEVRKHN